MRAIAAIFVFCAACSATHASSSDAARSGGSDASGDGALGRDGAAGTVWSPGTGPLPWQWELDHALSTASTADMATGDTTYADQPAAAPLVYDIDGFDNDGTEVAALHALGKKVICYIEVGAAESYRPDYAQFPAAALGNAIDGYPDERYLDITDPTVVTVIEARIAMCAHKGFDGIEPDIDDSYTDDTGFSITETIDVAYLATLSSYAHSLGIAWGLKNGGDGGDPATFVADMLPHVELAVVEEPYFLHTIGSFSPAIYDAGKALFVAEYTDDTSSASSFCAAALADHSNAALFDVALDAKVRVPCQ
ncbi:MAG TPA: endo alpha-1,4 polygalactosaminidase [Kofleriaceae bacterium]|nr:endo alpha-1,4 polygalactosaminidase [Kofleriaceae bacterium]